MVELAGQMVRKSLGGIQLNGLLHHKLMQQQNQVDAHPTFLANFMSPQRPSGTSPISGLRSGIFSSEAVEKVHEMRPDTVGASDGRNNRPTNAGTCVYSDATFHLETRQHVLQSKTRGPTEATPRSRDRWPVRITAPVQLGGACAHRKRRKPPNQGHRKELPLFKQCAQGAAPGTATLLNILAQGGPRCPAAFFQPRLHMP